VINLDDNRFDTPAEMTIRRKASVSKRILPSATPVDIPLSVPINPDNKSKKGKNKKLQHNDELPKLDCVDSEIHFDAFEDTIASKENNATVEGENMSKKGSHQQHVFDDVNKQPKKHATQTEGSSESQNVQFLNQQSIDQYVKKALQEFGVNITGE